MARTPSHIPPKYPKKPHKGQARLTVRLVDGRRHDLHLGALASSDRRSIHGSFHDLQPAPKLAMLALVGQTNQATRCDRCKPTMTCSSPGSCDDHAFA